MCVLSARCSTNRDGSPQRNGTTVMDGICTQTIDLERRPLSRSGFNRQKVGWDIQHVSVNPVAQVRSKVAVGQRSLHQPHQKCPHVVHRSTDLTREHVASVAGLMTKMQSPKQGTECTRRKSRDEESKASQHANQREANSRRANRAESRLHNCKAAV